MMNIRLFIAVAVFLFFSLAGNPAQAQQDIYAQSRAAMVDHLYLKIFEAAAGDLSVCAGDDNCLEHAKEIKAWFCASQACLQTGMSISLGSCFPDAARNFPVQKLEKISTSMCALINSATLQARQDFMSNFTQESDEDVVQHLAYTFTKKKTAAACVDYIKSNVGPYGPLWNYKWYEAVSGCRILARESTRDQEEKDFNTWFGVLQGVGHCSDIVNKELQDACSAPQAASPFPFL